VSRSTTPKVKRAERASMLSGDAPGPPPDDDAIEDRELRPTLVRASAGTGKTYRLTARLLKILLQGAPPESILATTFTRKAAGEILDRVLLVLAEAADPHSDAGLQQLRSQVGIATLPRSVCLQLLEKLLRNIHRLRICTLDSLFAQLARSFPFELGLPPAWRLTDEIEEMWLKERAVDSVTNLAAQAPAFYRCPGFHLHALPSIAGLSATTLPGYEYTPARAARSAASSERLSSWPSSSIPTSPRSTASSSSTVRVLW